MDKRFVADHFRHKKQAAEQKHAVFLAGLLQQHPLLAHFQQQLIQFGREELQATLQQDLAKIKACQQAREDIKAQEVAYLNEHGIPLDYRNVLYSCPLCKDSGMADFKPCSCYQNYLVSQSVFAEEELAIHKASLQNFNLSLFSAEINGDSYSQRDEMKMLLQYAENYVRKFFCAEVKDLFLAGLPGTGKTYLAACILHALREKGVLSIFISAQSLFRLLQEEEILSRSFHPDPARLELVKSKLEMVFTAKLLVIDDLGSETIARDLRVGYLLRILNQHTCPDSRLLLTTNLDKTHLLDFYDERILSRLNDNFYYIYLGGKDLRGKL